MALEFGEVGDLDHFSEFTEGAVVGELSLGHAPGLGGGFPAGDGGAGFHAAADLGRDAEADAAAAHVGQGDGVEGTALEIGHAGLDFTDAGDRQGEIPVPFEGVETEIEVDVEDQIHGWRLEIGLKWGKGIG